MHVVAARLRPRPRRAGVFSSFSPAASLLAPTPGRLRAAGPASRGRAVSVSTLRGATFSSSRGLGAPPSRRLEPCTVAARGRAELHRGAWERAGVGEGAVKAKADNANSNSHVAGALGAKLGQEAGQAPGVLQLLPMVPPADELMGSCFKAARREGPQRGVRSAVARAREQYARQMRTLALEFATRLDALSEGFVRPEDLHDFEHALVVLTLGPTRYMDAVAGVERTRRKVVEVAKQGAATVSRASTLEEVEAAKEEGFARVRSVYLGMGWAVDELKTVAQVCRRMPVVDLQVPTLALVGAPNVGKSSLVGALSSGKPEVCNYPFTTKAISMGHMYIDDARLEPAQITDTPGLLARPDDARNDIEGLAIAALAHLPTAALFALDLSEECGTSAADQLALFVELRQRFPDKPWMTVANKDDLDASESVADVLGRADVGVRDEVKNALRVSVHSGQGMHELRSRVVSLLHDAALQPAVNSRRHDLAPRGRLSSMAEGAQDANSKQAADSEALLHTAPRRRARLNGRAAVDGTGAHRV